VHGNYIATVADGKITELALQTFYQEGNRDLPAVVRHSAAGWGDRDSHRRPSAG